MAGHRDGGADRSTVAAAVAATVLHPGAGAFGAFGTEVETGQPGQRLLVPRGDGVEIVLHRGGEPVVDQVREVALEQADHGEGGERGDQGGALLPDVAAVEDGGDHAGIGGRPAHPQLLHGLDQRSLRVAGRRLGGVRPRVEVVHRHRVPLGHRRAGGPHGRPAPPPDRPRPRRRPGGTRGTG